MDVVSVAQTVKLSDLGCCTVDPPEVRAQLQTDVPQNALCVQSDVIQLHS